MAIKKSVTTFLAFFLVLGFITFGIPQDSNAGAGPPPINPGCCQFEDEESGKFFCVNSEFGACKVAPETIFIGFFEGSSCNRGTGLCTGFAPVSNVPTLSEWGLIAMAGVLGIVGFMVMRRKRATA